MAELAQALRKPKAALPVAAGAGLGLGVMAAASTVAPLAAVGGLALGCLLLASPEAALALILLFRPMLDLVPQGLAVPGSTQVLDLSAGVALLLTGAAALHVLSNRTDVLRIPLVAPFAALLAVATVSLLASSDLGLTAASLVRLMGQLALYVLVFSVVRRRAQAERFVVVLIAAAVPPVVWGFGEILVGHAKYLHPALAEGITHPRLAGPFGEGLTLGSFLLVALVLTVVLSLESRRRQERFIYASLLAFFLVALYLTLARGPWLAFALALGVLAIARYRVLLLLAPLTLLILLVLVPGMSERWAPIIENPGETTLADRLSRWEGAWTVFREHPIVGAGLGVGDLEAGAEASGRLSPAHDDYLRVLADTGVLGLAAYLWLLCAAAVEALRAHHRLKTPRYRAIVLSFLAVWAAFMILRVSGNVLTLQILQYYFWALAAVALALPRVESTEQLTMADASRRYQAAAW
jgi:O-antigen ligase